MKKHILLAAAASLALTPAAYAQMSPGKPGAAAEQAQLRPADQTFITKAANAGMFEVRSSELALDRAQNAEVKSFARQMIKDHGKANKELQSAASGLGAKVPSNVEGKEAQAMQKLEGLKGPEFDQAYVPMQRDAHREAVGLFSNYSKANGALSAWAAQTLPVLEQHQQHIQQIGGVAQGAGDEKTGRASTPGGAGAPEPAPGTKNMKPKSGGGGGNY